MEEKNKIVSNEIPDLLEEGNLESEVFENE